MLKGLAWWILRASEAYAASFPKGCHSQRTGVLPPK